MCCTAFTHLSEIALLFGSEYSAHLSCVEPHTRTMNYRKVHERGRSHCALSSRPEIWAVAIDSLDGDRATVSEITLKRTSSL